MNWRKRPGTPILWRRWGFGRRSRSNAQRKGEAVGWFLASQTLTVPRERIWARQENQLRRKMHAAGFPYAATIDQFDFTLRPELKRTVMLRFFDSSFIAHAGCLLLIGASGLGKTHLAVAVGTKMVQLGYTVRFVMAQHVANAVLTATTRSEITRLIEPLVKCDLLILDEFGYLSMEPQVGPVLYEIISARYQKGATVIASNESLPSGGARD